ncbi:hypothetical protein N7494_005810 [Penicillium frequentans]|uniref:Uncharacterized protein n=1 Tax=Penicillium frequentans TaxID=3151616 RepID=A0AAD6GEN9_9EURO|nr:hypothetical protein N7494_005810 [Penicillium glabrum]
MGTEPDVHSPHLEGENDEVHAADRVDMSWAPDQGVEMQGRYEACRWDAHIAATGSSTSIQDWEAQAPLGGRCATLTCQMGPSFGVAAVSGIQSGISMEDLRGLQKKKKN